MNGKQIIAVFVLSLAASRVLGQVEVVSVRVTADDTAKPAFFLTPFCSNQQEAFDFSTVIPTPCAISATHNACTYSASSSANADASVSGPPDSALGFSFSGSWNAATSQVGSNCAANGRSSGAAFAEVEFLATGESTAFSLTANATPAASGTATEASCTFILNGRGVSGLLVVSTDPDDRVDTLPRCGVLEAGFQYQLHMNCTGGVLDTNPVVLGPRSAEASGQITINFFSSHLLAPVVAGPGNCVESDEIHWDEPAGGAYENPSNWNPAQVPVHAALHSDTAIFDLPTSSFLPIVGNGATAGAWTVSNSMVEFSGTGQVFSTSASNPSLSISDSGQLRLPSGASLDSVHASVGAGGTTNSVLEVKGGAWANRSSVKIGWGNIDVLDGGSAVTGALTIGAGNGTGAVRVTGDVSTFDVTGELVVGDATAGTLEIDQGAVSATPITATPVIGKSAPGAVSVRGDYGSSSSYGLFLVNHSLIVGEGASGRLTVGSGGIITINQDLVVNGSGANPAGEVVVDAQGAIGALEVLAETFVNATELREVLVQNGGRMTTHALHIGNRQVRPGAAEVTLRGASGASPTLTVGPPGGSSAETVLGEAASGQLNVEASAIAELNSGLHVGEGSQGIVRVVDHSTLTVTGETQVGIGGPGFVTLDTSARMENHGDLKIGLGGDVPSGTVDVGGFSYLRVDGVLSVGAPGVGFLNISSGSGVRCGTLTAGGNAALATGIIDVDFFSALAVDGNAQVGVGAGPGQIQLKGTAAILTLDGTMTIGNPAAGPGWGIVFLADGAGASIVGSGNIVVNKNGCLIGSGSIPSVNSGGMISMDPADCPGLVVNPTKGTGGAISARALSRTLSIDGNLELLPGGVLILGYDGLNPGEFDVLHVTGQATLGGRLEIHFRGGFLPDDPDAFIHAQDFVEAAQGVSGDYDQRIYAFPDLFADFDNDGDKDLRDVAAFQNCFGLSGAELEPACERADWERDGVIGGREIQELGARLTGP